MTAIRAGPLGVRDFRLLLAGFTIGQLLGPLQFLTQILWVQAYAPENVWLILVITKNRFCTLCGLLFNQTEQRNLGGTDG